MLVRCLIVGGVKMDGAVMMMGEGVEANGWNSPSKVNHRHYEYEEHDGSGRNTVHPHLQLPICGGGVSSVGGITCWTSQSCYQHNMLLPPVRLFLLLYLVKRFRENNL